MSIIRELARLGNKIDSASAGEFLSKGTSTGSFDAISYTSVTGKPTVLDSALSSQLIDSSYIQLRQTVSGGGLDSALTTQLIDSSYVSARAGSASSGYQVYEYTATQGQTTFQDSDLSGNLLSYTSGGALVFYNGVLMGPDDITATTGSSVVLASGADSGSHVSIAKWSVAGGSGAAGLTNGGDRAVHHRGYNTNSLALGSLDYWDITTTGNAQDFGDLVTANRGYKNGNISNKVRGVFVPSYNQNNVEYITFATTGNATDFGDMSYSTVSVAGSSDGTYGYIALSYYHNGSTFTYATTHIDKITISTAGNATDFGYDFYDGGIGSTGLSDGSTLIVAGGTNNNSANGSETKIEKISVASASNSTDFGDLTLARYNLAGCANATTGLFTGGQNVNGNGVNVCDYITVATPGNATDFGDLTASRAQLTVCCNTDRAVVSGGYNSTSAETVNFIEYFTMATPGNSIDFGDLVGNSLDNDSGSGNAA